VLKKIIFKNKKAHKKMKRALFTGSSGGRTTGGFNLLILLNISRYQNRLIREYDQIKI